jgi:hypothetical protein
VILEGIVTTINPDGSANISALGPQVDAGFQRFVLRPFESSRTCANLVRTRRCVMHVVDDALLLARVVCGRLDPPPRLRALEADQGVYLEDACRWYALRILTIQDRSPRATMECEVTGCGRLRDFYGWNRACHAVVEAAILASRTDFLPATEILDQFARLRPLIDKTGGQRERDAFALLEEHVRRALG